MLILFLLTVDGFGEVIFDGSMNDASSNLKLNGKNMEIKSEYGRISGNNLFHSFKTFNVHETEGVTFTSDHLVQNVIARVTGNHFSTINGEIRSNIANANLFLINPQGISFGERASINIGGSFYVGTADYVASKDAHFYASIESESVLFSENPTSFGFLSDIPEKLDISGWNASMDPPTGRTVSFIAGDIEVKNANLYEKQGTINLASVALKGEVDLNDLDQSDNCLHGNIQINHSEINVSGDGSGDVFIRGGEIIISNESSVVADNTGSKLGGQTRIKAKTLTIDHSYIYRDTTSTGDCGQIKIQADKTITLINSSRIYSDTKKDGTGNAGTIELASDIIQLVNQSKVSSDTYGDGQGGSVYMIASQAINILNESEVLTVARGKGNGGAICMQSPNISIVQNSQISTDTMFGYGNGGTIDLEGIDDIESEVITIYDSKIYSGAMESGFGNGGKVQIKAKKLSFINGAEIGSESDGRGKGGDVSIISSELNFMGYDSQHNPSAIYTTSKYQSVDAGDAGNISIQSDIIRFQNQSRLIANTEGPGQAGQIKIEAGTIEMTDDSSISSASLGKEGAGSGGQIMISIFSELRINHSVLLTSSFGDGHAGHISISAKGIYLSNHAGIRSESNASINGGTAGKITVMADDTLDIQESFISTKAINTAKDIVNMTRDMNNGRMVICAKKLLTMINGTITSSVLGGMGNGGDIEIDPDMIIMQHSQIKANAYEGNGGNIHIVADHFIQSSDSIVQASSRYGLDGDIFIDAPDAKISNELITLPTNYLDASQWLRTLCSLRSSADVSRLVISGRDAIPSNVEDLYMSPALSFFPDDGSDPLRSGELDEEFFKFSGISQNEQFQ